MMMMMMMMMMMILKQRYDNDCYQHEENYEMIEGVVVCPAPFAEKTNIDFAFVRIELKVLIALYLPFLLLLDDIQHPI